MLKRKQFPWEKLKLRRHWPYVPAALENAIAFLQLPRSSFMSGDLVVDWVRTKVRQL